MPENKWDLALTKSHTRCFISPLFEMTVNDGNLQGVVSASHKLRAGQVKLVVHVGDGSQIAGNGADGYEIHLVPVGMLLLPGFTLLGAAPTMISAFKQQSRPTGVIRLS